MKAPKNILNTTETRMLRDKYDMYFQEKMRLQDQVDESEKAFEALGNSQQRFNLIQLTRERIRQITAIMLDLDDTINKKLNIYGKDNQE